MDMSTSVFKKIRFYIIFGVIIIAILSMLDFFNGEPKGLKDAESYLFQNSDVVARVGKIQKVDLLKWRSVYADGNTPAYREFRFDVRGDSSQATVIVKVDSKIGNNISPNFSIISMENR